MRIELTDEEKALLAAGEDLEFSFTVAMRYRRQPGTWTEIGRLLGVSAMTARSKAHHHAWNRWERLASDQDRREMDERFAAAASMDSFIEGLTIGTRARNCLRSENIRTVREVIDKGEDGLLAIPNCGRGVVSEVRDALKAIGLPLPRTGRKPADDSA